MAQTGQEYLQGNLGFARHGVFVTFLPLTVAEGALYISDTNWHTKYFSLIYLVYSYADFKEASKSISKIERTASKSISSYRVHDVLGPKWL